MVPLPPLDAPAGYAPPILVMSGVGGVGQTPPPPPLRTPLPPRWHTKAPVGGMQT